MARKIKKRKLKDRILLVSEGKKTEQNYFKGLAHTLRISIEFRDIDRTSLGSLFAKAKRIFDKAKREKNPFTQVIFIGDKDNFQNYEQDKKIINNTDNFCAFFSEPCFEYWLLLHFQPIDKPFNDCGKLQESAEFKKNFPEYDKTNKNIFNNLKDKIPTACKNARNNPHTNINELVEYLQNIKNQ